MVSLINMNSTEKIPCLEGYLFSDQNENDEMWSLRLETNENCNILCKYCYASATSRNKDKFVDLNTVKKLVEQAIPLGLKSVIFIGPGEPLLYTRLFEALAYLNTVQITPVIITNGTLITEEIGKKLLALNVSILMKYDGMNPETQDYLAGKKGTGKKIHHALSILQKIGYTNEQKLGLSFVTTKQNISEAVDFWKFCRKNNIFPNMEHVGDEGRAKEHEELFLESGSFLQLKQQLAEIDKELGYSWDPSMPLPGIGCNQFLYSCYVSIKNKITPCAGVTWGIEYNSGTVLNEMWHSEVLTKFRETAQREGCLIDGRYCWGCRGTAFNYWIKQGISAEKAVTMLDPDCSYCSKKNDLCC